jgi:hypothetical protein
MRSTAAQESGRPNAALQKQLADLKNNQDALQKNQRNPEAQVNACQTLRPAMWPTP